MKKKLVIAGGTSFIARNLIKELSLENYEITSLVRKRTHLQEREGVNYISLSMQDYNTIDKYISKCDCYIPFTWNGTKRAERNNRQKNEESYRCILDSIQILIEKCGCTKIILPGSFLEYKNQHVPIDEETICDSELEYGRYKYKLYEEAYKLCVRKGVKLVETRLFGVYGEEDNEEKMLNQIMKRMLRNEDIRLTRGEQIWNFLYISDVVNVFRELIEKDVESGCYNIASNEHRTLKSYIEEMKKIMESKSNLVFGAVSYGTDVIPHMICITDKIREAIDWAPEVTFSEGIKRMQYYYKRIETGGDRK